MKTYIIGREKDCDIFIDASTVSRQHAEITVTRSGKYFLIDRASSSGTFVSGVEDWEEITQSFVELSDTILFGRHQLAMSEIVNVIETGNVILDEDVQTLPDNDLPSGKVRRDPETGEPIRN